MQAKLFEVRDIGTFYSVLAVKLEGDSEREKRLLERVGFGKGTPYKIQLTELSSGETHRDCYSWELRGRTLFNAHKFIAENFDTLESGAVIDVAYLLGLREEPVKSDIE